MIERTPYHEMGNMSDEEVAATEVVVDAETEAMADGAVAVPTADGGAEVTFGEAEKDSSAGMEHGANLAEFLEDADLQKCGSDLEHDFDIDLRSRKPWEDTYIKGLDYLGMKFEDRTKPWDGACGVFHPILLEAVIRFQAQAITEIFHSSGPAKTKIIGKETPDKVKQAIRVKDEINHQIVDRMKGYRKEFEHLLFRLPLAGSCYKKVYYNPDSDTPVSEMVIAEDFVVAYQTTSLATCPRATHRIMMSPNDVLKRQVAGFYRKVDLPKPEYSTTQIKSKEDKLKGQEYTIENDDRHTLLEMHVEYDPPEPFNDPDGIARPYVITIDKTSRIVLAIRRNWRESDTGKNKRDHFVDYTYIPGLGFYGVGMINLIGGLTHSATSILRQLVDAGTLSNLPGGMKTKGLRIKGDETPIEPGEWRDVDIPGGTIKDNIYALPYKEPSAVLHQLLTQIVDEARRLASIADMKISDVGASAPVGTTLAMLEPKLKVMTSVQARTHASQAEEFRLIRDVIVDHMDGTYDYETDGEFDRKKDFAAVGIIPVSDPNSSTTAQRVVQHQAAYQMSQGAPEIYNKPLLHRQMLQAMDMKDAEKIVPMPEDVQPMDPVSENMAILNRTGVKAFYYQDHDAHLAVHLAAMNDPKITEMVGQSQFANAIKGAMESHILEHIAFGYRKDIEKQMGAALPEPGTPLPEDIEHDMASVVAAAADKVLQKDKSEAAAAKMEAAAQDPMFLLQKRELDIKEMQVQSQKEMAALRAEIDALKEMNKLKMNNDRITSEEKQEGARLGVGIAKSVADGEQAKANRAADIAKEGMRVGAKIGSDITKQRSREAA